MIKRTHPSSKLGSHDSRLKDVKFIQVRYTDILGKFRAKYVHQDASNFNDFFERGIGLDGSSVKGFADIEESDLLLLPDSSTEIDYSK